MIVLHRLGNEEEIMLNALLVEYVHATPDTMVHLTDGHVWTVGETVDEVVRKVESAQRRVLGLRAFVEGV